MLTQNLERVVRSYPMAVRFAGFESDTRRLAASGWDLSMRQETRYDNPRPELQLAMRFSDTNGCHFYAISRPLGMDWQEISRAARVPEEQYIEMVKALGFDIMFMGQGARFQIFPMRMSMGASFLESFQPIDSRPTMQDREERLEDFKFFKVAATPKVKDLIVSPEDVPELLDAVLKAQAPLLSKIKKREQSRKNFEEMKNGFTSKPGSEVVGQILAVS